MEKALDTLRRAQAALDEAGFSDITLCPETMGKIGQLGTLDEVLALCRVDRRITPCIDFGHLNARTLGGIASKADYAAILDRMEEALGDARARRFQVHFSRIEYTAGGEKRHWTFAETQFGPEPQPLMELLAERRLEPVIICESAGTQARMRGRWRRCMEGRTLSVSADALPPLPRGEALAGRCWPCWLPGSMRWETCGPCSNGKLLLARRTGPGSRRAARRQCTDFPGLPKVPHWGSCHRR